MIKVCMITDKQHYADARVSRYIKVLTEAGAQVDILCVRGSVQPSSEQPSGVRVFTIPIGRALGGVGRYLLQYAAAFILFTAWLLALYIRNRYQVIHMHNPPDFLVFAALIPKMLGAKVILDIHDPMPEFYMTKLKKTRTRTSSAVVQLMRVEEKLSAALAHAVITVNSEVEDILVKTGIPADKITLVRNLPDPKVFDRNKYRQERQNRGKHFTLIYPGTITPQYGLDVAIRAVSVLRERIPQLRLIIMGDGSEFRELPRLAEQLGVSALVQFKRSIPNSEVPRQLAQADVGIYSALSDPYMNITTPTKVLEYAAMGLPIIASRLKPLQAVFPESAFMYFDPGDVQQFAHCVLELFDNLPRREEMVQNVDTILFARKLCWSNDRRVYLNLLNVLLAPREGIVTMDIGDGS